MPDDKTTIAKRKHHFMGIVTRDKRLRGTPQSVAHLLIYDYWNRNHDCAWPSIDTLRRELQCSRNPIKKSIKLLGKLGYFKIISGSGSRQPNRYFPCWGIGHPDALLGETIGHSSDANRPLQEPSIGHQGGQEPCIDNPINEPISSSDDDGFSVHQVICIIEGDFKRRTSFGAPPLGEGDISAYWDTIDHLEQIINEHTDDLQEIGHAERVKTDIEAYLAELDDTAIRASG
jgi:hypothetical protein